MINKTQNIFKDKRFKMIVETDPDLRQITLPDARYYQRSPGVYYPSVTTVLGYFPKGAFFETWLKDSGHNSDIIMRRAGDEGNQVHNAAERILRGEEIRWIESDGYVNYNTHVWRMILSFYEFWTTYKPKLIMSEQFLYSDTYKYSGTLDLLVELNDKIWIIDIKTSTAIHTSHYLQMSAYVKAYEEIHNKKVDHTGILWLKSSKRSADKTGKRIQGYGWELKEGEKSIEDYFKMFLHTYDTYKMMHPEQDIEMLTLPNSIKL